MIRQHVIVRGQVQGVGFRWSAQAEAHRIGVTGYARNRRDGTVEVEVEGEHDAVERMLHWLGSGPEFAQVDGIDVTDVAVENSGEFTIA